jgi:hypothetical protein
MLEYPSARRGVEISAQVATAMNNGICHQGIHGILSPATAQLRDKLSCVKFRASASESRSSAGLSIGDLGFSTLRRLPVAEHRA